MNSLENVVVSSAKTISSLQWQGLIPVLNTPFTLDGKVDIISLINLCDYVAYAKVPAVLVLGVASENAHLSAVERDLVLTTIAKSSKNRFDIIADLSESKFDEIPSVISHMSALGVAAVNWRPTSTIDPNQITTVLRAISTNSDLCIMLQDFDLYGAGLPDTAIIQALGNFDRLQAVKIEVQDSVEKINRLKKVVTRPVTFCSGWPISTFLDALVNGADVSMSTSLTPLLSYLIRTLSSDEPERAHSTFATLEPLFGQMTKSLGSSIRINKEIRVAEGVFETNSCRFQLAKDYKVPNSTDEMIRAAVSLQESLTGWR